MLVLRVQGLSHSFADRKLFAIDDWRIYRGDRVGIVGANGCGKTTLLNILLGRISPDKGSIKRCGTIGYIPQLPAHDPQEPHMSGGERTRRSIASALQQNSLLLLADEPTSNLDIKGIRFLEQRLQEYDGAMLLVSHDRALLDSVCNRIVEIADGNVRFYSGNYTDYLNEKTRERKEAAKEYEKYISEKRKLEKAIEQRRQKASKMHRPPSRMGRSEWSLYKGKANEKQEQVQKAGSGLQRRLDQLEQEKKEKPKETENMRLEWHTENRIHSPYAAQAKDLTVRAGDDILLKNIRFTLPVRQKTALLGDNGSGKTTLIRCLVNRHAGITLPQNLRIGYFRQDLRDMQEHQTLLEYVSKDSLHSQTAVRTILAGLLFKREDVFKTIAMLSGGERIKAALARLIVSEPDLLILDEPTNYLDIPSREALESVLCEYRGTLLFVSHDRTFVGRVADRIIMLANRTAVTFEGRYSEYRESIRKSETNNRRAEEILQLENRLNAVLGKLSISSDKENKAALDEEYREILKKLKALKS